MTPWFRQRAQVGERLTALLGISSVPGGALVSSPVAESEAQWWTMGTSLASMDLEAGVEGQGGHVGPLLTSPPAPGRPHLKGFPRHPSVDSAFTLDPPDPPPRLSSSFTPLPSSGVLLPRRLAFFPGASLPLPLRVLSTKHCSQLLACAFLCTSPTLIPVHSRARQGILHPLPPMPRSDGFSPPASSATTFLPSCIYPILTTTFMLPVQFVASCTSCKSTFPLLPFKIRTLSCLLPPPPRLL